jgi:hypothetical protein
VNGRSSDFVSGNSGIVHPEGKKQHKLVVRDFVDFGAETERSKI